MSSTTQLTEAGHLMRVEYQVSIQIVFVMYLMVCSAGMFNRLYRVCAADGDRTVLYFFYRFAFARQMALKRYQMAYGWDTISTPPALHQ
jgi:hypothetical protein